MLLKGLCFLGGALLCARLPVLPPLWLCCALPLPGWLVWRYRYSARRHKKSGAIIASYGEIRGLAHIGCLCCGFLWTLFHAQLLMQRELPPHYQGRSLLAHGVICSLPETRSGLLRFNLCLDELHDGRQALPTHPGKVRLSWYRTNKTVRPGEHWQLTIRLKRPHGLMNPGGFDYEAWLFQNRLRATGYVVNGKDNLKLAGASRFNADALRLLIKEKIHATLPQAGLVGFIPALVTGDRSGLDDAHWKTLTATGANHLIAISGLHVGLVAGFAYALALRLWSLTLAARLRVAAPRVASLAAMAAALCYALLAGFALPTQRALVMVVVCFGMRLRNRALFSGDTLGTALLAVLLFDPFAPMAASFWLSFGAVAVILYGTCGRVSAGQAPWRQWGRVQYAVTLGLVPALAFYYQQIPVFSLFANLLAVPWVGFVVVPLALVGCASLFAHDTVARWLLELTLWSLQVLWWVLEAFTVWDAQLLPVTQPGLTILALSCAGALILLLPAGITARWLGAIWLLPLFFTHSTAPPAGQVDVTVLDVGQGLAIVARTQRHALLFDSGPAYPSGFDTGEAVVLPFLRSAGITALDRIVLSHGDMDHRGGIEAVIRDVAVADVISSAPEKVPHDAARRCHKGQSWEWDGVYFQLLHPSAKTDLTGNDGSCVLRISATGGDLLLTGDIEKEAERRLLQRARQDYETGQGVKLRADVLLAPHHGSGTSSSAAFVGAVAPRFVIFSAGYRNRFNMPNRDIIRRYREHGARLLGTAESGAIQVNTRAGGVEVASYREKNRRFWHTARQQISPELYSSPDL